MARRVDKFRMFFIAAFDVESDESYLIDLPQKKGRVENE